MMAPLCACEPLDDFGYEVSWYPGFAIADGFDRLGEKRVSGLLSPGILMHRGGTHR